MCGCTQGSVCPVHRDYDERKLGEVATLVAQDAASVDALISAIFIIELMNQGGLSWPTE